MPTCNICGKDKQKGEYKNIYTGKISSVSGIGGNFYKTTYVDIQDQTFYLCKNCHLFRDVFARIGVGLSILGAVISFIVILKLNPPYWVWVIPFVIPILVVPFSQAYTKVRLKNLAVGERGDVKDFVGFTEREYAKLLEENYKRINR